MSSRKIEMLSGGPSNRNQHQSNNQMAQECECCVCYSTNKDITARYTDSFITIPCDGKHVVCFKCFMKNDNKKCPMCRYDYVDGVRRDDEEASHREEAPRIDEEEQRIHEEEQHWREQYEESYDDHDYTFYQDLNREFAGNYQQAIDEAIMFWKEFARLDRTIQDEIYEKLNLNKVTSDNFYIYKQIRIDMYNNEDNIMNISLFDTSFDVCRVVYLSKIISQPGDEEAVECLKQFEERVEIELDSW